MKTLILLSLFLACSALALAQDRPPWVDKDLPLAGKAADQGEYKVVSGEGASEPAARQNAITAFIQMRNYEMGVTVSADQNYNMQSNMNSAFGNGSFGSYDGSYGSEGEQNAGSARIRADERNMSFRIIDTYSEKSLLMGTVKTWLLIWVPNADGNGMNPPKFVVMKSGGISRWSRGGAFVRSLVVPGWGQLYKGQRLKGLAFMVGTYGALAATVIAVNTEKGDEELINAEWRSDGAYSYKTRATKKVALSLAVITSLVYGVQLIDAAVSGNPIAPMPGQIGSYRYLSQHSSVQLSPWVAMQPAGMPAGSSAVGAQLRIAF